MAVNMNYSDIKRYIRSYYGLHGNCKILLNNSKMTFILSKGECLSMEIDYPLWLKRELKLKSIGI